MDPRLTPSSINSVLDLESQLYTARLEHQLVEFKSRKWIAWLLFTALILGWVHAFDHERRSIASHIDMLWREGPPLECYYNSNDPNHPIPLSLQISYWMSVQSPAEVCHAFYTALTQSRIPSPWVVTVKYSMDTFLLPAQHAIRALAQAPWFLQLLLVFGLCATAVAYLGVRMSPLKRD